MRDVPVVARAVRFYLIAGEPSGDRLGAALMAGLRSLGPVEFHGVGGPLMAAEGLVSQFPMAELSVMGIAEVLPKYFALKRRIAECAAAVRALAPDALITIDSPDFCLRVAALVRPVRTIHYVAPSVWAWRPGRAVRMARLVDHVLALLPFEPPYMTAAGMGCTFVGHPVVAERQALPAEVLAFRAAHAIAPDAPVILALPGSRRGEIARLAPRFGQALRLVLARHPGARIVIPTLAATASLMQECTADWPLGRILLPFGAGDADARAKAAAFGAGDVALAASGTVSLELAAAGVPMVIGYDMAWATRQIMAALIRTDTVTLVNLVADSRTVPEFLGANCRPEPMAEALLALLADGPARAAQVQAMAITMDRLGRGGEPPGLRAARAVLAAV